MAVVEFASGIHHRRIDVSRATFNAIALYHRYLDEAANVPLDQFFIERWTLQYGGELCAATVTGAGITLYFSGWNGEIYVEFGSEQLLISELKAASIEVARTPAESPRHPHRRPRPGIRRLSTWVCHPFCRAA